MNEKRFIELQLGAAKAQISRHIKDSNIEKFNDIFRSTSTALLSHAAASRDYWQSKLDELGDDGFQQPFDVFNALKKASEWVAPIQDTSSKEAP
jgi:hypothetical protein